MRRDLRNLFTHSVDPTDINIFHYYNVDGKIKFDDVGMLPEHPYINIMIVIEDMKKNIIYLNEENEKMRYKLKNEFMLVEIEAEYKCERKNEDKEILNIRELRENLDTIRFVLKEECRGCENCIEEGVYFSCRPTRLRINRIYEEEVEKIYL